MIKEITSLKNPFVKELLGLKSSKIKKQENRFLIEGEDLVELAYLEGQLDMIITLEENSKYQDIDQVLVNDAIIAKLSNNKSPSKILGVAHYKKHQLKGNKIVYLDNVQDPGNVGTIIRTALSFSYDAVVLGNGTASIYNDKVIQSSKGGVFRLPVFEDLSLEELKEQGYEVVSTALHGAIDYKTFSPKEKFILVFGNEGQGISEQTLKLSDALIKISMSNIDSLNVAIAAGILMNEYRGD